MMKLDVGSYIWKITIEQKENTIVSDEIGCCWLLITNMKIMRAHSVTI
jgi:hypothetical protein